MLDRSPLFLGLARPPKYLGLPIGYLVMLVVGTVLPFVMTKAVWVLALGAALYLPLWFLADREPRFFDILRVSHGTVRGTAHAA